MSSPTRSRHRSAPVMLALAALSFTLVSLAAPASGSARTAYRYLSPVPGSSGISPANNIIIRDGRDIDPASVARSMLMVVGSSSGAHAGRLVLSDDRRTLVFNPERPFAPGERVTVSMPRGPIAIGAAALPPLSFEFSVAKAYPIHEVDANLGDEIGAEPEAPGASATASASAPTTVGLADLPTTYPPVTLTTSNNPDPGYVYCTPVRNSAPVSNTHMMILDNNAQPLFYRKTAGRPVDFKRLPDGRMLYYEIGKSAAYLMNEHYQVIDSIRAGNGYTSDSHDTQMLPNNHALILIHDAQPVDMSVIVPGGNPEATVIGLVIQEIDEAKNVVWQWRSWDHLDITDMSTMCANLTDARVDYIHGNAIEVDHDGHLLVSGRYLNEIFKINRDTGEVMWRFGKNAKRNQFTIVNDPFGFSDQHDVRRLPNGHITMFDNHFCIDPKVTRTLEYELDEQNLVATLVWEYHHAPEQQSVSGGGYQRREGGGGMIAWANVPTPPAITDLHADGSTAWEVTFWPAPLRSLVYRAFRFPHPGTAFTTDADSIDFGTVAVGDSALRPLTITNNTADSITFTSFVTLDSAFTVVDTLPIKVAGGGSVTVQAKFRPGHDGAFRSTLYVRSVTPTQLIAWNVTVTGAADTPTPTLFTQLDAAWTDDGVEVRWEYGATGTLSAAVVQRSENAAGPWVEIAAEPVGESGAYRVVDRTASPTRDYFYRLAGTLSDGSPFLSRPLAVLARSVEGGAAQLSVSPNPGAGATRISFVVPREARVRVSVLDAQGRRVAVLANGTHAAGQYHATWGAAGGGARPAVGLYFVRYEGPWETVVRRLVMVR